MDKPQLVQQYMDEHTCHASARTAVIDGQDSLSYSELEKASNQLAHFLKHKGIKRQDHVVFSLQRSVNCLTAILGILKADAVYVPLDPKTPELRRRAILADCSPRAILCDKSTLKQIDLASSAREGILVVVLDLSLPFSTVDATQPAGWREVQESDADQPSYSNQADDLACIMYTSGSTGQPKGVMITHRNIRAYIDWAVDCMALDTTDRILGTAPFHFDMSTFDVHSMLKAGGTLCIANEMMTLFPEKLVRFIEEHEITVWKGVSSLLMYLARAGVLGSSRMPSLKTILFAGEPLPAKYLIQWMSAYPGKKFINAYGPTETTGVSLYYQLDRAPLSPRERIPVGRPCTDTEVFLLLEDTSVAGEGVIGELCIAGPGLARGYLNDPLKTAQSFIEPEQGRGRGQRYYLTGDLALLRNDGHYEYISRKDNQVKIMGYRIDLGEVEHALLSIDGIEDAAALVTESEHAHLPELVACYEASMDLSPSTVMMKLKSLLPGYMIPKRLLKTSQIPRKERGKIDRSSLCQEYSQLAGG
ncbi:MAG: amino acid adenylation domain-containing protein [Desulfuromonadales bacterium]|nr:amino acid adenylation domain-containing protein [Desulfuromonadales bacterium]